MVHGMQMAIDVGVMFLVISNISERWSERIDRAIFVAPSRFHNRKLHWKLEIECTVRTHATNSRFAPRCASTLCTPTGATRNRWCAHCRSSAKIRDTEGSIEMFANEVIQFQMLKLHRVNED